MEPQRFFPGDRLLGAANPGGRDIPGNHPPRRQKRVRGKEGSVGATTGHDPLVQGRAEGFEASGAEGEKDSSYALATNVAFKKPSFIYGLTYQAATMTPSGASIYSFNCSRSPVLRTTSPFAAITTVIAAKGLLLERANSMSKLREQR